MTLALGPVGAYPVSRYLMLAYDDVYANRIFPAKGARVWRRNGAEAADMIRAARREHDATVGEEHAVR